MLKLNVFWVLCPPQGIEIHPLFSLSYVAFAGTNRYFK